MNQNLNGLNKSWKDGTPSRVSVLVKHVQCLYESLTVIRLIGTSKKQTTLRVCLMRVLVQHKRAQINESAQILSNV